MASTKPSSAKLASMEAISAALEATEAKKQTLFKAFLHLHKHTSCIASFKLEWNDIEEHFNSIQKSLEQQFKELEDKEKQSFAQMGENPLSNRPSSLSAEAGKPVILPELFGFCVKRDGVGLRDYVMDNRKGQPEVRDEIVDALKSVVDPEKLVLDAMQGFYPINPNEVRPGQLGATRRTCNLLLDSLIVLSPLRISPLVKEEAKKMAVEWKKKAKDGSDTPLETFAFLQMIAAFRLASEFNYDEVLDLLVTIVRRKQVIELIRVLGLTDKVPDFVQKLSCKGKQLEAIKFVHAFDLIDKFPPVPLLKAYLKESKNAADEVLRKGNNSLQSRNEAIAKELAALRDILRCIEEHHLESQYPREELDKRIDQLEKQRKEKKRPADAPKQMQQQKQNESKQPRAIAQSTTTVSTSTAPHSHSYGQHTGLLPDPIPSYLISSARNGLLPDPVPSRLSSSSNKGLLPDPIPQYFGSSAQHVSEGTISIAQYSAAGSHRYRGTNPTTSTSRFYSSDPNMSLASSTPYDRALLLDDYGYPPAYHPSYYP